MNNSTLGEQSIEVEFTGNQAQSILRIGVALENENYHNTIDQCHQYLCPSPEGARYDSVVDIAIYSDAPPIAFLDVHHSHHFSCELVNDAQRATHLTYSMQLTKLTDKEV